MAENRVFKTQQDTIPGTKLPGRMVGAGPQSTIYTPSGELKESVTLPDGRVLRRGSGRQSRGRSIGETPSILAPKAPALSQQEIANLRAEGYSKLEIEDIAKGNVRVGGSMDVGDVLIQRAFSKKFEQEKKEAEVAIGVAEVKGEDLQKQIEAYNQAYGGGRLLTTQQVIQANRELAKINKARAAYESAVTQARVEITQAETEREVAVGKIESYGQTRAQRQVFANVLGQPLDQPSVRELEPTTRITAPELTTDITKKEFEKRVGESFEVISKQTSPEALILGKAAERELKVRERKKSGFYGDDGLQLIREGVDRLGDLYSTGSDIVGYGITRLASPKFAVLSTPTGFGLAQTGKAQRFKTLGIKNPFEATLFDIEGEGRKRTIAELKSEFYTGKILGETGSFLVGGAPLKIATAGSMLRAETPEDLILPLALGGGARVVSPFVGAKAATAIPKINTRFERTLNRLFTSRKPVLQDVLVPSKFPQLLTESRVAKGVILGGAGAEVAGLGFIPLSQKEEYIRQVGLYNVFVPYGYRAADIGIATGKFAGIKTLTKSFDIAERFGKDIRGFDTRPAKELMDPKTFVKFQKTGGGTPILRGDERTMISALQDVEGPGVGAIYRKYGIDAKELGIGAGIRTVRGKQPTLETIGRGYYESIGDYYSNVVHPIALQNVGLKNRLFRRQASLRDRFVLGELNPVAKFTVAKRGTAIQTFADKPLTPSVYKQLNELYGYRPLDFSFSKDVKFRKATIPQGQLLSEFEYQKILGGKRPIKTGDFLAAGFSEDVVSAKLIQEQVPLAELGGFVSTRPRAFRTTSEAEVLLPMGLQTKRIVPQTRARKFFRKLGFSDAYIDVGFEYVPLQYRQVVPKEQLKLLGDGTKYLENRQKLLEGYERGLLNQSSIAKTGEDIVSTGQIVPKSKGGYTAELEDMFGTRQRPIFDPAEKIVLPVYRKKEKKKDKRKDKRPSLPQYIRPSFRPIDYPVRKIPRYDAPRYLTPSSLTYVGPRFDPKYDVPTYTPSRMPDYKIPSYDSPRIPDYKVPGYTPPRIPPVKPPITLRDGFDIQGLKPKKKKSFYPYIREKGKWIKASKTPFTKNRAWLEAQIIADNTTAKTISIKPSGKTTYLDDAPNPLPGKFRQKAKRSKITKNPVYIERNRFAIDSIGEKQQLSAARYLKRMNRVMF